MSFCHTAGKTHGSGTAEQNKLLSLLIDPPRCLEDSDKTAYFQRTSLCSYVVFSESSRYLDQASLPESEDKAPNQPATFAAVLGFRCALLFSTESKENKQDPDWVGMQRATGAERSS